MLKRTSLSIAIGVSTCLIGQACAAQNDLGSRWPGVADVSVNPYWHVYVFHRSGVEYVQVNDLNGNVRQVVATSNGNFLVLPMGLDVARVTTPQETAGASDAQCGPPDCGNVKPISAAIAQTSSPSKQLVYQDGAVTVTVTVGNGGSLQWTNAATSSICQPPECGNVNQQPTGH